jgi:hypothetical protein
MRSALLLVKRSLVSSQCCDDGQLHGKGRPFVDPVAFDADISAMQFD